MDQFKSTCKRSINTNSHMAQLSSCVLHAINAEGQLVTTKALLRSRQEEHRKD